MNKPAFLKSRILSHRERRDFVQLLNQGGYVLHFSTESFDQFTQEIVGVALCEHYGLSKGKSLEKYLSEAARENSILLLAELMNEWVATSSEHETSPDEIELGIKCQGQLEVLKESIDRKGLLEDSLKENGFTSDYLDKQREILAESIRVNPTLAIGTAKELVESCCKTVLEERGQTYDHSYDLPRLVRESMETLGINAKQVGSDVPEAKTVSVLLGSLAQVGNALAELRNPYGSGHGKSKQYKGLSERHARLAAGSAITLTQYLWDTHLLNPNAISTEGEEG